MASLYRKARSPFWYLEYQDQDGTYRNRSTGLRADDPHQTQAARVLRAEAEASEIQRRPRTRGDWDWVDGYLRRKCESPLTLTRYATAWRWLNLWLMERKFSPENIRYAHAAEYVDWRTSYKKHSGKKAGRNTAILEVKVGAMILGEAVRMERLRGNPWLGVEIAREEPPQKRELTEQEIDHIRRELAKEPVWMHRCFEISLHTGCRLRETVIPIHCVDFGGEVPTITFPKPKGGRRKAFSIPIPDGLLPLLREIHAGGEEVTLALPFQPSRHWSRFFHRIGLHDITFHCLRVTRITELWRAGVPREVAMRLVNHSSSMTHQLYVRHHVRDLAQWVNRGAPRQAPSAGKSPNRTR